MGEIVAPLRGFFLLVLARDRGLRYAPPPAIRLTPLRGGLPDDSHHPARPLMRRNEDASGRIGCIAVIEPGTLSRLVRRLDDTFAAYYAANSLPCGDYRL